MKIPQTSATLTYQCTCTKGIEVKKISAVSNVEVVKESKKVADCIIILFSFCAAITRVIVVSQHSL